jgi:hypothetical protein
MSVSTHNPTVPQPAYVTNRDPFGPVGAQPTFLEPSDYQVGEHVVYHHFDGKDYEAVITDVWGPGSDVTNRWAVHLDAGSIGLLRNITQASREDTQPEGTFSLKPRDVSPLTKGDDLVKNRSAGAVLPTRADENPRPQSVEREERGPRGGTKTREVNPGGEPLRAEDFDWSAAPVDAPEQPYSADALVEVRDDQVQRERGAPKPGEVGSEDPGGDTPANLITANKREGTGEPLVDPLAGQRVGTTVADDDEHVGDSTSKKTNK